MGTWPHGGLGSDGSLRMHPSPGPPRPSPLCCAGPLCSACCQQNPPAGAQLRWSQSSSHVCCEPANLARTSLGPGWPLLDLLCQYCDLELTVGATLHLLPSCVHQSQGTREQRPGPGLLWGPDPPLALPAYAGQGCVLSLTPQAL